MSAPTSTVPRSPQDAGTVDRRGVRRPGLDAIRGVAVLLVLLRHAFPEQFGGAGIVGVTMFFTLSGYLITGLLDQDLQRRGRIAWRRFFCHRAFRLFPALLALLAVFAVVEGFSSAFGDQDRVPATILTGVTYTADLPLPWLRCGGMTHLWSLAVEEQFYLVWPIVLGVAFRRRIRLGRVAMLAAVALTAVCIVVLVRAEQPADLYERPTTWASTMAIGGAAYLFRARIVGVLCGRRLHVAAGIGALLLIVVSLIPDAKNSAWLYALGPTAIGAASAATILALREVRVMPAALQPVGGLGRISYGCYLWSLPLVFWFGSAFPGAPMVLTIPATIAIAALSWCTVERFGRRLRSRFDERSAAGVDA